MHLHETINKRGSPTHNSFRKIIASTIAPGISFLKCHHLSPGKEVFSPLSSVGYRATIPYNVASSCRAPMCQLQRTISAQPHLTINKKCNFQTIPKVIEDWSSAVKKIECGKKRVAGRRSLKEVMKLRRINISTVFFL